MTKNLWLKSFNFLINDSREEEFIKMFRLERYFEQEKGFMKTEIQEPISYISPLKRSYNVVVEKGKSDLVFKTVPIKKLEEKTFNEALYHILQEPLTSFIESPEMVEGKNIHCPFHDDSTPSGRVFKSNYGQMVYHCHACNVGTKNIIGLYMAHTNKNYRQSVVDLAKIIGIKVVETEFEQEQFRKYRENRLFLEQDLKTLFPNIAYFIEKYGRKSFLRYLNDKAETSVLKEEFQYKNENVFFVSFRAIAKEMNKKSMETVVRVIYLLNLLGFIERVPYEYVPEELRKRAEIEKRILQEEFRQQGEPGERRAEAVRLINFYIVRNWNDIAFEIEQMAKMMKEKNFTFANLNKIGLTKMFGEEIANRVFPDDRKVPSRFEKIAERLEKEVEKHIQEKSFAIMEEILKTQVLSKDEKGKWKVVRLSEKEDIFKRAILASGKYQVSKVRSEKKKKQLGYAFSNPKTIHVLTHAK